MPEKSPQAAVQSIGVLGASFFLLVFVPVGILLALLGTLVGTGPIPGLVVALFVAAAWLAFAWLKSEETVLDLCDAAAADEKTHARLFNTTAGLCTSMGVAPPSLYVVEDPAINLLATGTNARSASLVVTEGTLEHLSVLELEGVVAYELHRIKSGSIVPETFVVGSYGLSLVVSEHTDGTQWLSSLFAAPAGLISRVISRVRRPRADMLDDLDAVSYTRSPPALASALEKMNGHSALAVAPTVAAHLWLAPSLGTSSSPGLADLHSSLDERIAVLREL